MSKRTKASVREGDIIVVDHLDGQWRVVDKLATQLYLVCTKSQGTDAWVFITDSWTIAEDM